jgi:hypothetical protein
MNPTLRGLLLVAFVAALIVVLQLEQTLVALSILLQVAFLLAIAFFVFLVWRERRSEIATWPTRARAAFYGAALVIVADVAAFWLDRPGGLAAVAFLAVLVLCGIAMVRVWRDQQRYV